MEDVNLSYWLRAPPTPVISPLQSSLLSVISLRFSPLLCNSYHLRDHATLSSLFFHCFFPSSQLSISHHPLLKKSATIPRLQSRPWKLETATQIDSSDLVGCLHAAARQPLRRPLQPPHTEFCSYRIDKTLFTDDAVACCST